VTVGTSGEGVGLTAPISGHRHHVSIDTPVLWTVVFVSSKLYIILYKAVLLIPSLIITYKRCQSKIPNQQKRYMIRTYLGCLWIHLSSSTHPLTIGHLAARHKRRHNHAYEHSFNYSHNIEPSGTTNNQNKVLYLVPAYSFFTLATFLTILLVLFYS